METNQRNDLLLSPGLPLLQGTIIRMSGSSHLLFWVRSQLRGGHLASVHIRQVNFDWGGGGGGGGHQRRRVQIMLRT